MAQNNSFDYIFSDWQTGLIAGLAIFIIAISKILKLNLEKDFFTACLRTTLQLICVGFLLRSIFENQSWAFNILALLVMTTVGAHSVVSRLSEKSWKLGFVTFAVLLGSVWPLGLAALVVFFWGSPFDKSSFFIPFMGVLLGNALSCISLAFLGLQRAKSENLLEIETLKALGATPTEACQRIYRKILHQSLTPILNGMTIVGIVSLPGVMAGQLLGGVDPMKAAQFQILVMFLILLTALIGGLLAIAVFHSVFMPQWLTSQKEYFHLESSRKGQIVILKGPSGSGKSRFLKSLIGLDHSEIRMNVLKQSDQRIEKLKNQKVSYVHQKAYFVPGSVEENLRLPYQFSENSHKSYDQQKIHEFILELGLKPEILKQNATTLSGGEGQLIHLIRSLQLSPDFVYLDEPTSSLDSSRTLRFEKFLREWCEKNQKAVVLITHSEDQIQRVGSKTLLLTKESLITA